MSPTLNRDFKDAEPYTEDLVLVNLWKARVRGINRGDVVVFRSPQNPEKVVTKRVVAVEGDMVYPLPPYPTDPLIIQWGQIWVEGDNEDKSKSIDSNTYGSIPAGLIVGKVVGVIWPWWNVTFDLDAMKDTSRVLRRAVALRDPDEVSAERQRYWKAKRSEINQESCTADV